MLPQDSRSNFVGELSWAYVPIFAGFIVYITYVTTHLSFPAGESGLYLEMAEQIVANGGGLPAQIPFYTSEGIPFAYPPLMFYVINGVNIFTGVDYVTITLLLPGVVVALSTIPLYRFTAKVLDSQRTAAIAALLFITMPATVGGQFFADGFVNAPALLFTFIGLNTGLRLFEHGDKKCLFYSAALFGAVLLTHPPTTLLFITSFLALYGTFRRDITGLILGAAVALGGIVVASPWWLSVISVHGLEPFVAGLGTAQSSLLDNILLTASLKPIGQSTIYKAPITIWFISILGGVYLLVSGRFLFPLWAVLTIFFVNAYTYIPETVLAAVFITEVVLPALKRETSSKYKKIAPDVFLGILLITSVTFGGAFAVSVPSSIDSADREAFDWIEENTPRDSSFVTTSTNTAEWLPYSTKRTLIGSPWGAEWLGQGEKAKGLSATQAFSKCTTADCLKLVVIESGYSPDYVYAKDFDLSTARRSESFEVVYEQDDVGIIKTKLS